MMIGIIYGTERTEATVKVVEWLTSNLLEQDFQVEVHGPDTYSAVQFDKYDGFIVGTAVYAFRPWGPFLDFLHTNKSSFEDKPIGTFVVCGLPAANRFLYMWRIKRRIPTDPISEQVFKGYSNEQDESFKAQKEKAAYWIAELAQKFPKA